MSATVTIVLLWIGFAGTHLGLSSLAVRQAVIGRVGGDRAFQGLYSLVAFGFFIPLVTTYFRNKHSGAWLWMLPRGGALHAVMYLGMSVAFILLVASLVRRSPALVVPGDPTPAGVYRITRHPMFMAFALFALMHLLPNGSTADVAFFGGFVIFSLVGAWHQDRRKLALDAPGFRHFHKSTPFIPFTGADTARGLRELSPLVIGLGLLATVVVRFFHASWFGG